jgi:hypothetical protein
MKTIRCLLIVLFLALVATPIYAEEFVLQYLAAACPVASKNNSQVVETEFGPGVQHRDGKGSDVVIHCSINPDAVNFFNWFQLVAEDNTPNGYATATVWRAKTSVPGPPERLDQVTTTDAPGVQVAVNNLFEVIADVENYVYWIEIRIVRTSPDAAVTVYSVTLKDVL